MGVLNWSLQAARNALVDPLVRAADGASARDYPAMVRGVMAGMRAFSDDAGGAITTGGFANAYTVKSASGITELRPGIALLVRIDRDNTAEVTLNVDGTGPLPWLDAGGLPLKPGRLLRGRFYTAILDATADGGAAAWRIQAGASTLDEIPGLNDSVAQVSANTQAVAQNAATVAAQSTAVAQAAAQAADNAATVATQTTQVVASRQAADAAAQTATAQAATTQALTTQAQAAVATGRVAYDTLAQLNGNLAPADGAQGEVRSDGGNTGTYQKSGPSGSGSWVFKSKATVPALDARTSFAEDDGGLSGYLWALAPNNRLLLAFEEDGTPILKLGRTPLGDGVLDPTFSTLEGDASAEVDAAGRILALCTRDGTWLGKYANPAGVPYALSSDLADQTALLTRINRGLSAYGLPKTEIYGAAFLRECHARFAALLDYDRLYGGTSAQAIIAMQGDSWSTIRDYYVYRLAKRLVAKYGDAGPGWVGFGFTGGGVINACARDDVVSCTKSGSWTSVYGTAPSPDHSAVLSSTPGDRYTVAYVKPSGGPDIATVRLFAVATADGQMRYSFNAGATWTALDLTGSGAKIIDVSGVPAGSWTLWLEHVSGTSNPCGLDLIATTAGVRFHKLGSSGTRSSQWVSSDAATYQAMLAALAPSVIGCLTGTNSQTNYAPEVDRGYTQTLIDRWKAALPASDYFLATPPANNSVGNAYPMSDYAEVHRQLAYGNGLAHLDLQYAFGPDPSQYAFGSSRPLLDATLIHPTQNRGGYVVASRVQRLLEFA